MTGQVILYRGWYSPELCQQLPGMTFVFGDNLLGFGKGGQAIIRNEPNAFGVPTKRKPAMTPESFFDNESERDLDAVLESIRLIWTMLESDHTVVIPVNDEGDPSLGLERARLREKAPDIYEAIKRHVGEMCDAYGREEASEAGDLLGLARDSVE